MASNNHLCELLTNLRASNEYSIRKMAKVCGVSRESIRKYETGACIPSNQTLKQIFDKLGIDPQNSSQARLILISVYQARRERRSDGVRSFGPAAQLEIENITSSAEFDEVREDKLLNLFLEQVDPERRTESFSFFMRQKIKEILRS